MKANKFFYWFDSLPLPEFLKFIIIFPLFIVAIPIITIQIIIGLFKNRTFNKKYQNYLHSIEGTKFFCYNNRKTSIEFIEQKIIPKLSPDIEIVFVNGKIVNTRYEHEFISHALYSIKRTAGFPYLLKATNGKMMDCSINKELYTIINRKRGVDKLIDRINAFYNH